MKPHTNQLIFESSPYLLQHAHNPVNWMPYGEEAFALAKRENKPVLISIGYSACHWCHVMEHESFENEEIAHLMNSLLVCIKVDREERPDVDHVYMDAVQQIHGNGGWPLNCFALPDGRPFWGGTYFRPEQWKQLVGNVNELFQNRYSEIEIQASELTEGVMRQNYLILNEDHDNPSLLDFSAIFAKLYNSFDKEKGGMQGSPKFPMPAVLQFLFDYGLRFNEESAVKLVETTLQSMGRGGIYDQIGGGFARYSTDTEWKVPHFEKMLYDNAQLISVYSSAFQITGNRLYKEVIEQTIEFVKRDLGSPEGIFYSALDADSDGEEGLFYTWTPEEFSEALGHYSALAGEYYGIGEQGLWENGRSILLRPESDDTFAQQHFLSAKELDSFTGYCRAQLLKFRSARLQPGLDDKMLVAWNAQMVTALVDASLAVNNNQYMEVALNIADFILNNLKRNDNGLFHTWKNGKSQINAFLDDYAFVCESFLKLYSHTTDVKWLKEADSLATCVIEHFFDTHSGFFWYSDAESNNVFARKIEIYDGVIPSGNSVIAGVLNTLGVFLHKDEYLSKSNHMLQVMGNRLSSYPAAYSKWASIMLSTQVKDQKVIAIVGLDAITLMKELLVKNLPGVLIFGSTSDSNLPYFEKRFFEGKTLIYICSGTYCLPPVSSVEETLLLLGKDF